MAAVYAVIYAVFTGAIVALVFSLAQGQIYTQIRDGLVDESTALSSLLAAKGPKELRDIVRLRDLQESPHGGARERIYDTRYYILTDPSGRVLISDLSAWPPNAPTEGWYRFHTSQHGQALALITTLPNGMHLLIGQSLAHPRALSAGVELWVAVGAGVALLVGLLGGAAIGIRVMRQIHLASAAAGRIQSGRLDERLPMRGASEQTELASAFNTMLDRIERAVLGLRDLASRTAHEMKNPLARADRALARAAGETNAEKRQANIASARTEISDLASRVNALLRLARLQGGATPEFFSDVDLGRLAADVVELYAPFAEEHGRALKLEAPEALHLSGDRQLLAQALANLIENAIKYGPPGRPIVVRLLDRGEARWLEVAYGDGTVPTGSLSPGQAQSPGAGLGLAITRAIAELHGGTLELARGAAGFTATLCLPQAT